MQEPGPENPAIPFWLLQTHPGIVSSQDWQGPEPRIVRTTHPAAAGVLGGLALPAMRPRVFQPGVL